MAAAAPPLACRPSRSPWGSAIPRCLNSNLPLIPLSKPKRLLPPLSSSHALVDAEPVSPPPPRNHTLLPPHPKHVKQQELYLGFETWNPPPPPSKARVSKPESMFSAASLAYLGDCVYKLYARRHFLYPPSNIDVYNERVRTIVRCESQDVLLKKILQEDFLTEEERAFLKWGRNNRSGKKTRRRAGGAIYSSASSLETLIGHLYLTDMKRLEELMLKLGFTTNASAEKIIEKSV